MDEVVNVRYMDGSMDGVDVGDVGEMEDYVTNTFHHHTFRFHSKRTGENLGKLTMYEDCKVYFLPPTSPNTPATPKYKKVMEDIKGHCPGYANEEGRWKYQIWFDKKD
uniref:Uncharacterized protein n=2 Tax=Lotharella globosa TaxID=91324 RepID=A0A7S3YPM6_9EUKA